MQYMIRAATVKDLDFLDYIHTKNMKRYVEKVYPWKPTLFRDNFTTQDYQVVEYQSQIAGFIKVVTSETEIYLAEVQVSHEYQKQGMGTNIISRIIQQAKLNKKRLWLRVIKGNPAINLYQRLGFEVCQISSTHMIMEIDFK